MRYLGIALLVLALAGGAWASVNPETGTFEGSQPARVHFVNPSKDHMVPMKYQAPLPSTMPLLQRAPQNSQGPRIQWGTDVQVRAGYSRGISSDCFTTSPYHAYALAVGSGDTLYVYRTLNSGTSWAFWAYLPTAGIKQAKVLCSPGDTNWVALFVLFNNSGAGNLTAYYVDENFNQRGATVATGSADSTLEQFDAALQTNILNPNYYVTYGRRYNPVSSDTLKLYTVRSIDKGATWTNSVYEYGPTWVSPGLKITGGAGPYAFYTFRDRFTTSESIQIRSSRSVDYGATWSASQQMSNYAYNPFANYGVAAGPGDSTVYALHGFYSPSWLNQLIIQHSTNNGVTWNAQRAVRGTQTSNEEFGSIVGLRGGYGGSGSVNLLSLSFNVGTSSGDTTWSGTIYSNYPDSFMQLLAVGDNVASTSQGPAAGWIVRGSLWQPWTAYCGFGPTDVWADYDGVSGVEVEAPIAHQGSGISLSQNVPNPFGKGTRIAFSLPKSGSVDLAVYDIAGRKVATLAKGTMSAGSHEVSWNGAKAPAGVYFYRLSFEGKTLTNRMVVVR